MRFLVVALPLVLAVMGTHAQVVRTVELSAPELKLAYIDCDRRAAREALDLQDAADCSFIYEALKKRVFGGDYLRLREWWELLRFGG